MSERVSDQRLEMIADPEELETPNLLEGELMAQELLYLRTENARLCALEPYVQHRRTCNFWMHGGCTCGLDQLKGA